MSNQRSLSGTLGLGYVIIFVFANIIGSGVYKKIAPMAAGLESSAWILLAWAAAGVITLFGALSNAELAGMLADTGGEFVYLRKIYNPFFSFLYGWTLFTVIQSAAISSLAYVFVQSLNSIVPLPELFPSLQDAGIGGIFYPFRDFGIKITAILLIMGLTFLNISGLKSGSRVNKVLFFVVCAGLALIVVSGLANASGRPSEIIDFGSMKESRVSVSSFMTAMLAAFWAYQGWVSAGFIGGEIKNARRNVPKGIIIGVFSVTIIYLLVNYSYLAVMSVPELVSVHEAGNQVAAIEMAGRVGGSSGIFLMSLLILVTTLGCLNASILTGSRPYYAMSREGLFFTAIGKLNSRNVPGNSLLWQGIWSSVLVLSGNFDQLTDMLVFAVYIFYGAMAAGVFILRYRMPDAFRPYKVWGYPLVPALFVLFCAGLFVNTFITRPREALIGLFLIMTGVPVYFLFRRRNGKRASARPHD
ncbi:MAG TPA: amino acid permease [Bacteroidales bacterium]|jgi:APA family basic amino acid/polyamine antiporter|nr:amino acid permease [Bacteroidales bacterium]HOS70971.1 amino acid permease [Bacteroidales bacterium]HQH23298.1 amino acid permease [Bacteroidales bacterium]HQJ82202.1 amino acid permease [Bacteroidales bacterium]